MFVFAGFRLHMLAFCSIFINLWTLRSNEMKTKYVLFRVFFFFIPLKKKKKKIPNEFKKMTFGVFCVGDNEVTEFAVTAPVFYGTKNNVQQKR